MASPLASAGQVAAADAYERLFVPAEFQEWAGRVADAASLRPGDRVLDVACGTGALTREAARRVGDDRRVAGVDRAPGMLAVAARHRPAIRWCLGDAVSLPFADRTFDAVVSQFGLMYFSDRLRAIGEMRRVLVPGGRLAVAVWDRLENTPAYAALVALLERRAGRTAADALRLPFSLGDATALRRLFADAGVSDVRVTTITGRGGFPDTRSMIEAEIVAWMPVVGVEIPDDVGRQLIEEGSETLRAYTRPDGSVSFDSPGHVVLSTLTP